MTNSILRTRCPICGFDNWIYEGEERVERWDGIWAFQAWSCEQCGTLHMLNGEHLFDSAGEEEPQLHEDEESQHVWSGDDIGDIPF